MSEASGRKREASEKSKQFTGTEVRTNQKGMAAGKKANEQVTTGGHKNSCYTAANDDISTTLGLVTTYIDRL